MFTFENWFQLFIYDWIINVSCLFTLRNRFQLIIYDLISMSAIYMSRNDFSYLFTFGSLESVVCLHVKKLFQLFVYISRNDFSYLFTISSYDFSCLFTFGSLESAVCLHLHHSLVELQYWNIANLSESLDSPISGFCPSLNSGIFELFVYTKWWFQLIFIIIWISR